MEGLQVNTPIFPEHHGIFHEECFVLNGDSNSFGN